MQDFIVNVEHSGTCAVVAVTGELDIATAPQLVSALDQALDSERDAIVVNMLHTTFVDSTGLTTLFRAHKRVESTGTGTFSIVCGADNLEVRRVVDLMGFNEVFTIHETLAAAGCHEQES